MLEIKTSEINRSNLFSKLSFGFSILTIILFCTLINSIPFTIKADEHLPVISKPLIGTTLISTLLGFIFSIISLINRERLKYLKIIGVVINFIMLLIIIGIIGFALLMDWNSMAA